MKPQGHFSNIVSKAFWAAALVSADADSAEEAVAEALRSLDPEEFDTDVLLICVITLALQKRRFGNDPEFVLGAAVPRELRSVLKLSAEQRQCFVLRVLLSLPEDICLHLLRLPVEEFRELTVAASRSLAGFSEQTATIRANTVSFENQGAWTEA